MVDSPIDCRVFKETSGKHGCAGMNRLNMDHPKEKGKPGAEMIRGMPAMTSGMPLAREVDVFREQLIRHGDRLTISNQHPMTNRRSFPQRRPTV